MDSLPTEIAEFVYALQGLSGIESVESQKWYLPDVPLEHLALLAFGNLPLATLRRSGGGLKDEILVTFTFRPEKNQHGWQALEFLSWWARDQSRGGHNVQIRSLALPPQIGNHIQFGTTLTFVIEFFLADQGQDIGAILAAIQGHARDIAQSRALYAEALSSAAV